MKRILHTFVFVVFLFFYFSPSVYALPTYKVMTFNYKWIRPHNIQILKRCVQSNSIDFFGFQEMNFMDGASLDTMKSVLQNAGYRSDNIVANYTHNRREHIVIFYKDMFQYRSGPVEGILGGGTNTADDTRKIVSVLLHDPAENIDIRLFNQHPVSGENEQSCTQNKVAFSFVNQYPEQYKIFFGDFNLRLNATQPALRTSCNPIADATFSISCRPGSTSTHTMQQCGGKFPDNQRNLDFVMTPLTGKMRVIDSYYDPCGFSIGDSGSNDSDHYPLMSVVAEVPGSITFPTATPVSGPNGNTAPTNTPTLTPTQGPTATPTPTFGPRKSECNACGFCEDRPAPQNIDQCIACLYPGLTLEDTVLVEPEIGLPPKPAPGKYFTQIGCLDTGISSFAEPSAAGSILNFLLNSLLFPMVGILSLLALIYGSFLLITAKGNPEQIARGRRYITGAVVGALFAFGAILVVKTISSDLLKLPWA